MCKRVVAGAMAVSLLACTEQSPTGPIETRALDVTTEAEPHKVAKRTKARPGATRVSATFDRRGGTLTAEGVTLIVPAGALTSKKKITLYVPPGDALSAEFEPHGLQFLVPVQIGFTLTDTEFTLETATTELIGAYHVQDPVNGVVVPNEVMSVGVNGNYVMFSTWHFSKYSLLLKGIILLGG